jgi:hypothetical protein
MFTSFIGKIYKRIIHKSYAVYKKIRLLFNRVDKPVSLSYKLLRKDAKMALIYSVSVEPTKDFDVVKRLLTVIVNGELQQASFYEANAVDLGELSFSQGDNVLLSIVDYDDAENVSEPAVLEFVAADTIAPQTPSGFVVSLLREETSEVAPEAEVAPEVAPEAEVAPEVAPEAEVAPEVAPEAEVAPEVAPEAEVAPEGDAEADVAPEAEVAPEVAPEDNPPA